MGYVIYSTETTRKFGRTYKTAAAAKAGLTRAARAGKIAAADYAVADASVFRTRIEKMVKRTNLLSGKEYWEPANTPNHCSPSSEAYWSM